jgi:hypothetical protein
MKKLWLFAAGLGLVYLLVYEALKVNNTSQPATGPVTVLATGTPDQTTTGVLERAKQDAASRIPAGSTIQTGPIAPAKFLGDDLKVTSVTDSHGMPGSVVTLYAVVNDKPVSKLTYHVTADKIVFVGQEPVQQ